MGFPQIRMTRELTSLLSSESFPKNPSCPFARHTTPLPTIVGSTDDGRLSNDQRTTSFQALRTWLHVRCMHKRQCIRVSARHACHSPCAATHNDWTLLRLAYQRRLPDPQRLSAHRSCMRLSWPVKYAKVEVAGRLPSGRRRSVKALENVVLQLWLSLLLS